MVLKDRDLQLPDTLEEYFPLMQCEAGKEVTAHAISMFKRSIEIYKLQRFNIEYDIESGRDLLVTFEPAAAAVILPVAPQRHRDAAVPGGTGIVPSKAALEVAAKAKLLREQADLKALRMAEAARLYFSHLGCVFCPVLFSVPGFFFVFCLSGCPRLPREFTDLFVPFLK